MMEDIIKRDDAIQAVAENKMYEAQQEWEMASDDIEDWREVARDILAGVPSADPTGRRAEWIQFFDKKEDGPLLVKCFCSKCRENGNTKWHYCSNCGRNMKGEDDE